MNLDSILKLFELAGYLKTLKRTGWVNSNIPAPESVADHSYRTSLMALVLASSVPNVDPTRAALMALIHDLSESVVGDITPFCPAELQIDKKAREIAAIQTMCQDLPKDVSTLIISLFREYEDNATPTAQFVKTIDKLEMVLQASEYEHKFDLPLPSFFSSVEVFMKDIHDPVLLEMFNLIKSKKKF
ncbi:hypothetical protein RCL1_005197 [Eukaryota sp. TZLM3-RCL]